MGVCPRVRRRLGNRGCTPGCTQGCGEIISRCKGTLWFKAQCRISTRAWCRRRRLQSATRVPGENTTDCLEWAVRLDYLLELVQQIREGRLLRLLNDGLLVGLRYLLAHNLDVAVSTAVIVPDFAAGNRISDSEIEALLCAGNNVGQLDCEDKAVHGAILEGTSYTVRWPPMLSTNCQS